METKRCAACGEEKTIDQFSRDKNEKDGYKRYCKSCISKKSAEYRERNREQVNARAKTSYEKSKLRAEERTKEQLKQGIRTCSVCGETKALEEFYRCGNGGFRSYCKSCANASSSAYQKSHREQILQQKRKYHSDHKEEIDNYNHQYYKEHADEVKERVRKWNGENPDRYRDNRAINAQRKRALDNGLASMFSRADWNFCRSFFTEDGQLKCAYCGKPLKRASQDHVIPVASGGTYTIDNILPVCPSCNSSKSNKDFQEWYHLQPFYSVKREKRIEDYFSLARQYREGGLSACLCNA